MTLIESSESNLHTASNKVFYTISCVLCNIFSQQANFYSSKWIDNIAEVQHKTIAFPTILNKAI